MPSGSVAVTTVTLLVFSAILNLAGSSLGLVMTGDSIHIVEDDGDGLVVVRRAVEGPHDHFVTVVAVGIGERFEVRRADERQHAGRRIDLEGAGVGAARDQVADGVLLSSSVALTSVTRGGVLVDSDGGRRSAAIGGDNWRVVAILDGDNNVLRIRELAVGHLDSRRRRSLSPPASPGISKFRRADE